MATSIGDDKQPMAFPIEAAFSNDSKFVYALDPSLKRGPATGAVITFKITDGTTLEWVDTNTGIQVEQQGRPVSCFNGARGIALHPDGQRMFVIAEGSSTLTALDRDAETGATKIIYTATNGEDGIRGLSGGFAVTCSSDGEFVYTSSGRFRGNNAVGVFRIDPNGRLRVVQEFIDGENDLEGFEGGNEIVASPDGQYVYAAGTRSFTVAGFKREPSTGKLTLVRTESVGAVDGESLGPSGVSLSPDGRFLYIASETAGEVLVYRLDTLKSE